MELVLGLLPVFDLRLRRFGKISLFILNELFLYATAVFLKNNRFDAVNLLTERGYFMARPSPELGSTQNMLGFTFFEATSSLWNIAING